MRQTGWAAVACVLFAAVPVNAGPGADQQIHESLRALPESLRDGATVVGYSESGERVTLKKGSNGMTCWADDPRPNLNTDDPYYVVCFPESLKPYLHRSRELKEGKVKDRRNKLIAEIKAGKIPMPDFAVRYTLRGEAYVEALPLTVIHVPYRKAEGTGFSTDIDHFRPWLMWAGSPLAHIMVPGH
jgi:hypothetical protein